MSRGGASPLERDESVAELVAWIPATSVSAALAVTAASGRRILLRVTYVGADDAPAEANFDVTGLDLPELAGALRAATHEWFRLKSVDKGFEEREAAEIARRGDRAFRRLVQQRQREAVARQDVALHCSECNRPTAVIDEDGTRYCKRHAREAGIILRGKIGES